MTTSNTSRSAPPTGFHIRRATVADAATLAKLGAETFTTSFGEQNTPENVAKHLATAFGVEIQQREIADPAITYLIAEQDGHIAGYAQVRDGTAPAQVTGPAPVEVRRFYVVHAFHGTGIAQALMDSCAEEARTRGGRTLWLSVWSVNPRAIRFYTKWGFQDVGALVFMLGDDAQEDRLLVATLEQRETRQRD